MDIVDESPASNNRNFTSKSDTSFLYLCAVIASISVFSGCSCIVWSSPVIPKLKSTDPEENPLGEAITSVDISLITGLPSLVAVLGNVIYANLPNAFGRKTTLSFVSMGMLISLSIVAFGKHVYVYSAGLCFLFVSVAGVYVVVPLYLSEISENHNRGRVLSVMGVLMPLGNLYGYLLGPVVSVRFFTLLLAAPVVLSSVLTMFILPESPVYLAYKKRTPAALIALIQLRKGKNSINIDDEFKSIEDTLKARENEEHSGLMDLFKNGNVRKALLISLGINLTQQLSGIMSIMKFLGPVFNEVSDSFSGNDVAVLVGVAKFVSFFISSCLVDKLGRRPLLLASSLVCSVSLFLIGLFFCLRRNSYVSSDAIAWLPVLAVAVFSFAYALGIGTLPITVMNELFPADIKAVGSAAVFTVCYLLGASQVFVFPMVSESFGVHYCVWAFSFFCLAGYLFMLVFLPETKGKSYLEIQAAL